MTGPASSADKEAKAFAQLLGKADLVIFDFDGVIADSEVISLTTLQEALRQFGLDLSIDQTREAFLGTSLKTIKAYVTRHGVGDARTFPDIWEATLYARIERDLRPIPYVFGLIDYFDRIGQSYCIASSGTFKRIKLSLRAMGQEGRVDHIFSAQQVERGKPAPDLFELAARELGADTSACLVIEDSPFGVRAAKAAGMACIGFAGGAHVSDLQAEHSDLLSKVGADMVLSSYNKVIGGNPAP